MESARQVMIRVPCSLSLPPYPPTWICLLGTLPYPELGPQRSSASSGAGPPSKAAREAHLLAPGTDSLASQENNYS